MASPLCKLNRPLMLRCGNACFCRVGPGNFTPSPSQIRTLTLSRHPARATARRLPPSVENWSSSCFQLARSRVIRLVPPREGCRLPLNIGFLPLPVDPISKAMTHPLRSV